MKDYTIMIGANGEDGLIKLIQLVRFDICPQIYIVAVQLNGNSFKCGNTTDKNDTSQSIYKKIREVSVRQNNFTYTMDVYYSKRMDRYYVNVAQIVKYLKPRSEGFLKSNINGQFAEYCLARVGNTTKCSLVKVITHGD